MPHLGETFYGGNRHLSDHFLNSLSSFSTWALDDIDNDLSNAGVKVAIENHQDLDAYDLVMLCQGITSRESQHHMGYWELLIYSAYA